MARRRRPGRSRPRRQRRRRAVALGAATWSRRASGASASCGPPGLRCTAERGDAAQLRRGPRCSRAGELGRGRRRGPPPARTPTRARSDASASVPGIRRKSAAPGPMVQGLGVRPIARSSPKPERRGAGPRRQAAAPCFPTPRRRRRPPPERSRAGQEGLRAWFCGRLAWGLGGLPNRVR